MARLNREKLIALTGLFAVLIACAIAPTLCLKTRSDALDALADKRDMLDRLEAAHRRPIGKPGVRERFGAAPTSAFLNSQTSGLASAQLEAYLSKLVLAQQGSLVSSGVQQVNRSDAPDIVRVQATLDITYEALQALLYKLETGTPYVFVDSMTVQLLKTTTQGAAHSPMTKVTLNLRAIWHRTPI